MTEIDQSDLIVFQESPYNSNIWRFQTKSSKLKRQMVGRKTFSLTAYSPTSKLWIFRVSLPNKNAVKSRFKTITDRTARWDNKEDLFY